MGSHALTLEPDASQPLDPTQQSRATALMLQDFAFVWRTLRRLGLDPDEADDAAQHVFLTAARKIEAIGSGKERAFLFGAAYRVAAAHRRKRKRRERAHEQLAHVLSDCTSSDPESLLSERRERELLDLLLDELPLELRAVIVLMEIEQFTKEETARLLQLRPGTVASRVRKARHLLARAVVRIRRDLAQKERNR